MHRITSVGIFVLLMGFISIGPAVAQDEIRVVDYGANCDDANDNYGNPPSDDDTPALLAATAALYSTGERTLSLRGCKTLTLIQPWLLQTYKHNGIEIIGDGGGVGNDMFDIPAFGLNEFIQKGGSRILWKGGVGETMLTVEGPINGIKVRGIQFDAGHRAGTGIAVQHCWGCKFSQLSIVNYTGTAIVSTTLPGYQALPVSHGTGSNIWEQVLVAAPFGTNTTSGILLTGDVTTPFNTTWTTIRDSLFVYGGGPGTSGIELAYADNITIENTYALSKAVWDGGGNSLKFTRQSGAGCGGVCPEFPKENAIYKFMGTQPIGGTHGLGGGGSIIMPLSLDDSFVDDGTGVPHVLPIEPIENLRILTNRGDFYGPFAFEQLIVGDLPQASQSADVTIVREDVDAIMTLNTISDGDVKLKHRLDGVNEYTWTARRPHGELDLTDLSLDQYGHPTRYVSVVPGLGEVRLFDTLEGDGLAQYSFENNGPARLRGVSFASLDSPLPGQFTWCTDCGTGSNGECVAAGPGRWAFGTGGTFDWQCPF